MSSEHAVIERCEECGRKATPEEIAWSKAAGKHVCYSCVPDPGLYIVGGSAPEFEVSTAAEICARPDPPKSGQLIGPLLARGGRLVLGAHTGHGKTTLGLQMVKAVAYGERFLDWEAAQGRVLVIDVEQGEMTIKRRLREAGLEECPDVHYLHEPDGLALDDEQDAARMEATLAKRDYAAVLADPLYKLHRGDPNDERQAVDLMRRFDRWRASYGFGLILPVHCRKPSPQSGTKFSMHELFGASSYLRGAEVVLGLQRLDDGYSKLHFFKDRDGDLPVGQEWGLVFSREEGFRVRSTDRPQPTSAERIRDLLTAEPGLTISELGGAHRAQREDAPRRADGAGGARGEGRATRRKALASTRRG
jgi:hypothetical protein